MKTTSWPKPDSCQTDQHKTDHLNSHSYQMQTLPDSTISTKIDLVKFLAIRVAIVRS
jgi:hypothetical protein